MLPGASLRSGIRAGRQALCGAGDVSAETGVLQRKLINKVSGRTRKTVGLIQLEEGAEGIPCRKRGTEGIPSGLRRRAGTDKA